MPQHAPDDAPSDAPPRVVVLATGGTIASTRDARGALSPAVDADTLLTGVHRPEDVRIDAHQLMAVDSAAMTPADMAAIASRAAAELRTGARGVVVLHGTDTMEESALVADLTLARAGLCGPVVFTGAQRGADHAAPDGPANLALALEATARRGSAEPRRVRIAFAGRLMPVWGTRKTHTADLRGFDAWPDPSAADGARARALDVLRRLADGGTGTAATCAEPARVAVVAAYPGADGTAVRALVAGGSRGLVVEAMGAGNVGADLAAAIAGALTGGVPVVVTTRVPHGPVRAGYGGVGGGAALAAAGAVFSPVLRAGQARVLLAALLEAGAAPADIADAVEG